MAIAAGEFKTHCLKLMDEVKEKHVSFVITKRGKPLAKLVPVDESPVPLFGCLKGRARIEGDIVASTDNACPLVTVDHIMPLPSMRNPGSSGS